MINPLRASSVRREALIMAIVLVTLLVLPYVLEQIGGYKELATRILIWGIFALGFDLLVGFTGYLSFGHAAFWGVSAYVCGLCLLHYTDSLLLSMLAAIVVTTLVAFVLGYLTLRRRGIYFAILTLAFAEMLYYAALAPLQDITGGDNGLTGIPTPKLLGYAMEPGHMYWFVALIALLAIYGARRIARSPFGLMLRAIKSNEKRLSFTGVDTWKYKMMAFVISGFYAGLAGALSAAYETYVPTNSLHWTTSGEVVMMAVIGGFGTLIGPMIGAGLVLYLENVLSATLKEWLLVQGVIFMAFVIFLPGGVMEAANRLMALLQRKPARLEQSDAPAEEQSGG